MVAYCSYHPLAPATYACQHCGTGHCDQCVDDGNQGGDALCFNCGQSLESLGAVNHAVPFWRRLEESFRYPMRANAAGLIIAISVLTSIVIYIPFGFIFYLMLTGVFIKYCFTALNNTAVGILVPPDVSEAYSGGLRLILRLLVIFLAIGGASYGVFLVLGTEFAGLFGFLSLLTLPAIIIIFAMSDQLSDALNPGNVLRLISSIGLPYGLLLGFMMIMTASIGVINALLADNFSLMSTILQSAVSNYYGLVIFHIMGYMIFQYQGALGFTAREDRGETRPSRSDRDRLATKIDIKLKDGEYNEVVSLFNIALKTFANDREFNKQYFEFIYATQRLQALPEVASQYLRFLIQSDQEHQLALVYKRVLHLLPKFIPDSAIVRHKLAIACKNSGDSLTTAKLINGMQKTHADYAQLPEAMYLMADALADIPNQQQQAAKCRLLAEQLAIKSGGKSARPSSVAKPRQRAVFSIDRAQSIKQESDKPLPADSSESQDNSKPAPEDADNLPPIEFK